MGIQTARPNSFVVQNIVHTPYVPSPPLTLKEWAIVVGKVAAKLILSCIAMVAILAGGFFAAAKMAGTNPDPLTSAIVGIGMGYVIAQLIVIALMIIWSW